MPSAFILSLESGESDRALLDALEREGLAVDREYGLVKIDVAGRQRVARVHGTEEQVDYIGELGVTWFDETF